MASSVFASFGDVITPVGGTQTINGALTTTGLLQANSGIFQIGTGAQIVLPATSVLNFRNLGNTLGVQFKFDALPTIASGFGTSPAVTAGSTPLSGSVNVGTGAPGTGGVINFNGTAFPSAPFVVAINQTTLMVVRATATTTQLTLAAVAFTAGDVVSWVCISSK